MRTIVFTPHDLPSFNLLQKDIRHFTRLSIEEEAELGRRIRQGDKDACGMLVQANLPFLIAVAKRFMNRGLTLIELISAGAVGMIQAAKDFDERRGCKFITFAESRITQSIADSLRKECGMIHIPMNAVRLRRQINKLNQEAHETEFCELSDEELAEELHATIDAIKASKQAMTLKNSFDAPLTDDADRTIEDIFNPLDIPSEDFAADHAIIEEEKHQEVINMLRQNLRERDREIISMAYGLEGPQYTTQEIADHFGISDERVRQIKNRALDILRASSSCRQLRHYLYE